MNTRKTTYSEKTAISETHPVIAFLCTPRCGTQWLVKNLNEVYSNDAVVLHEPLENEYNPKKNLGHFDSTGIVIDKDVLENHFSFVEEVTQNKSYIEISWQSIAGISKWYERFGERLKLIHLYRNPVNVAASMVTHNWYTGKVEDRYKKAELTPFDDTAILTEYRSRWDSLSLFEKSLYYWTEINLRALEIKQRYSDVPFYSLKFENLFEGTKEINRITLIEMLSFMDLSYNEKLLNAIDIKYDHYQYKSSVGINWKNIFEHSQIVALANELGYRFDAEIDLSRYKKRSLYQRLISMIKSYQREFFK